MKSLTLILCIFCLFSTLTPGKAQKLSIKDEYLLMNAKADDPLYTTYTAPMERSRMYGDKGYKMDYYTDENPLNYGSDVGGRIFNIWMINKLVIDKMSEFHRRPAVKASFSDMVITDYEPFAGIQVRECFNVYSSEIAIVDMHIQNRSWQTHEIEIFPVLEIRDDSMQILDFDEHSHSYISYHNESLERLISDLYKGFGYPTDLRDIFTGNFEPYSFGGFQGNLDDFYNYIKTDFYAETRYNDSLNFQQSGAVDFISLHVKIQPQAR
ncbi:MAG: hypothetical protein U5Q03_05385 [Bacteroidota bacterium]|nr:hypothetical protein [Bacteroidota bacterium]